MENLKQNGPKTPHQHIHIEKRREFDAQKCTYCGVGFHHCMFTWALAFGLSFPV